MWAASLQSQFDPNVPPPYNTNEDAILQDMDQNPGNGLTPSPHPDSGQVENIFAAAQLGA